MVLTISRGLFQRAIVQSGSFALTQPSLADAEVLGQTFATSVHCSDQGADFLGGVPVSELAGHFPPAAIPGYVDGDVLTEPIATALAGALPACQSSTASTTMRSSLSSRASGLAVSNGTFVQAPALSASTYQSAITTVLGASAERAAAIAAEYPLDAYPAPLIAFSTLVSDANFACPALKVDRWTSTRVPTFG